LSDECFSRLFVALITFIAMIVFNFILFRVVPGDPVRMMYNDPRVKIEQFEAMKAKFGLDKSLPHQFVAYAKALSHGDLGMSFAQKRPVTAVIWSRLPKTLILVAFGFLLGVLLGTTLGAYAGWNHGTKKDTALMTASLTAYAMPTFCLGLLLQIVFCYHWRIFPLGGMYTPATGYEGLDLVLDVAWHLTLPGLNVLLWYGGEYVIFTRAYMLEVLGQDYINTARSKGLTERKVMRDHALRNTMVPVVTMTTMNIAFLLGGVIEIETVFAWPGIGLLWYDAILARDYPVLQGLFLVFAVFLILANLLTDVTYSLIDPRVRVGEE